MKKIEKRRDSVRRLLELVERFNLHHVKTLPYNHVHDVLTWLGILNPSDFSFGDAEDTVAVLNRVIAEHGLRNVQVMGINEEPQLEGKERLVVHINRHGKNSCDHSAIVLFLVIRYSPRAPYVREQSKLIADAKGVIEGPNPLFPTFATCPSPDFTATDQQNHPVIDGFLPSRYDLTAPNASNMTTHNFGQKYEPLDRTTEPVRWAIYTDIDETLDSTSEIDIERLIVTPNTVLGRGGFGVTVPIDDGLVAKTNLFPEMVNWSLPFVGEDFNRYAHVASQVEELMLGVSMKHPNILRTFGGFWCDIPGYQLGGRAVLIMERALFSLQEFMYLVKRKDVMPMVELDTLKGLEYLRSRTVQHRDFTFRNILVCHQSDRKPLPFTFKISDFGTSCNFTTPDQQRGNHTNMAPEALWCLNTATGSDIFSWYCVMWELHCNSPLVQYKGAEKTYCKSTYAENLSKLVGVYSPERDDVFKAGYMTDMRARELHAKHKNRRPSAEVILTKLQSMGDNIADRYFVHMGVLCITLYPQERWSPSELLSLPRYQRLSADVSDAQLTPARRIPLSVRVGEYRPTDIIACEDCVPEKITRLTANVIATQDKVHYGIDLLRLAPGRIEPYEWYSKKVEKLDTFHTCFEGKGEKRKADDDNAVRRQPKNAAVAETYPGEGPSKQGTCSPGRHLPPPSIGSATHPAATRVTRAADQVQETACKPQSTIILRSKRVFGELDTRIAILKDYDMNEIKLFKQNVILLSQTMTRLHPLLFSGPQGELCKCSEGNGVFIFQYGQLLEECKQVGEWKGSDSPNSVYTFLLQVFLTLEAALDMKLLPTHLDEWKDVVISKGAVMIDTVCYLSKNYMKPQSSMFGDECDNLVSLCTTLVAKHLPDSKLCEWLSRLTPSTTARQVLTRSISWLRDFDCSERTIPRLACLDNNIVTFRDYSADTSSNWLTDVGKEGEKAHKISGTNVLAYGHPKPFRGNQTAESMLNTKLSALVRNIILRMRVKIFKSLKLKVTALDCTQGLTKITLNNSALLRISNIDQLNWSPTSDVNFAHDAVSQRESKWAPVMKFEKCMKQGPVQELRVEFYKMTILVVLLSPEGSTRTVKELFDGIAMMSESDY